MSDVIKLVQGDTRPIVMVRLTDEDTGAAIDLSPVGTSVDLKFRAAGGTTVLSTITCTIVDAEDGKVQFDFTNGILSTVGPGLYEGELQINFPASQVQTVYGLLKFRVRQQF